jgi:hypothetical protein
MNVEVKRDDLRTTRVVDDRVDAADGQALLRIDRFALTSNNVTYAAFGEAMRYWDFFPATEAGWGRVPVWGFADVEVSSVDGIAEGERVYGYFPMASHLVVTPDRVADDGFVDASAHRAALPPVYNQYQRVAPSDTERETAILRPLFTTSFLLDDWLADGGMNGATSVILGSASSKTALGLAHLLSQRGDIEVVGLTSARNAEFVDGVGYYDRTVTYDSIDDLDPNVPSAFVDMGGSAPARVALHTRLGFSLKASCMVGATHWEDPPDARVMPGPQPSFFFAPDRVVKRRDDWGPDGFAERLESAWDTFLASVAGWLTIAERRGPDAIAEVWLEVLDGRTPPDVGYVLSPTD